MVLNNVILSTPIVCIVLFIINIYFLPCSIHQTKFGWILNVNFSMWVLHLIVLVCLGFDINCSYNATLFSRLHITSDTIALVIICFSLLTRLNNFNFSYLKFYWACERCKMLQTRLIIIKLQPPIMCYKSFRWMFLTFWSRNYFLNFSTPCI